MPRTPPPFPSDCPTHFRATVHGTVFGARTFILDEVEEGEELLLLPGPPMDDDPGVWVHRRDGDLIGHLPPEIEAWLAPWMLKGGSARARTLRIRGQDVPSWRRLLIEVACRC